MIVSYRDRRTRAFAAGKRVKAFSGIHRSAQLKLDRLEAATALGDLAALPATGSRSLTETGRVSTAFASTTNGGYVSDGRRMQPVRSTSRSLSTTRGKEWHGLRFIPATSSPKN